MKNHKKDNDTMTLTARTTERRNNFFSSTGFSLMNKYIGFCFIDIIFLEDVQYYTCGSYIVI